MFIIPSVLSSPSLFKLCKDLPHANPGLITGLFVRRRTLRVIALTHKGVAGAGTAPMATPAAKSTILNINLI